MKMPMTTRVSSQSPDHSDNLAIPNASPAADKVPNPLLSPLLSVAPAELQHYYWLYTSKSKDTCVSEMSQ